MSAFRASLIISTWNGRHLLETCLPRVLRAVEQDGGKHEVVVVDDGSRDDTVEFVEREFPQVRLVALRRNLRFAGANTAAARAARGEVLVFLNNDMLVAPDFLGPLLRHFEDPGVFAATARIEMEPTRVAGGMVRETGLVRARFEDGFFVLRHDEALSDEPVQVLYAGGGSSAVRRDRFFELGAFDRLFRPFYFEDLDVSYRAQKMGWRVVFEPKSRMVHQHRQTNSPRNFPSGYVDLMFGKNSLLFTWKVLTDERLLGEHFWSLWRKLMRPRRQPRLGACFLRAAAQLPELVVKRRRARGGLVKSDREVMERAAAGRADEATEAGAVPYGSTGTGRRVLVIGFAPLPFEREQRLGALCFRTWHVTQALLAAGHEVTLVGCRVTGAYREESRRPSVLRFRGSHFTYYSVEPGVFEEEELLQSVSDRQRPEAIVAVHAFGAWAASRLASEAPLWADLNGYAMTEAQARAAMAGGEGAMAEAWERESAALARADAFSVVSMRQKYALIGELAAVGRLTGRNYGEDVVHYMPNAIESVPYRHRERVVRGKAIGAGDFAILWSGGYNTWTDVDTLFEGVVEAMREEPRVKFVSLGGAMPGRDEETFYRFRDRVEKSEFADRFVFAGWVASELVPNYYFECDVGINIDRFSYEMLIGCRYRILDMLRAGLPVITTLGTEISHIVREAGLGMTFAPGDAEGLTEAILTLARDETRRRRCAERGREYVFEHRAVEEVMQPLQRWAREPRATAERMAPGMETTKGARSPGAGVGRPAGSREAGKARGVVRGVVGIVASAIASLLLRAFTRRRGTEPWGLDPREPPQTAVVMRAGPVGLTREVVERTRSRYPAAEISVLVSSALEEETRYEVNAPVFSAPGVEAAGYRVSRGLVQELRKREPDTVVVAGEGGRRAELAALMSGAERLVVVRDDGAAHVFWFAIYKPLLVLPSAAVGLVEKVVMSLAVGVVWGSLAVEGWLWKVCPRPSSPAVGGQQDG
ncbi:MAG: glycosyltransferase [Armatimonadota bacterium]|nr:MAG: glycosyltransferase [Armatimonadota bacterium]